MKSEIAALFREAQELASNQDLARGLTWHMPQSHNSKKRKRKDVRTGERKEKNQVAMRERYRARRARGECGFCGVPSELSHCEACKQRRNRRRNEKRANWREEGRSRKY